MAFALCRLAETQQAKTSPDHDNSVTFKSSVSVVLVPVLVRDAQGREVGDLKQDDFQVFDNERLQTISRFAIQSWTKVGPRTGRAEGSTAPAVSPPPAALPGRFIVFMFDDMHLNIEDLARAKSAGTKILAGSLADTDMGAVVSISGRVNSGLTRDQAKLQEAIAKLSPQGMYRPDGGECPNIDYYQADLIENKRNSTALEAATQQVFACDPALDRHDTAEHLAQAAAMRVLAIADQDVHVTLSSIKEFVRRMAGLPGQRTLVLVSPGFLTITPEALSAESQIMDLAAQSNVTVSALDARGLYTGEFDASQKSEGSAEVMRLKSEYHRTSMSLAENVMAELAHATGGTYFHNSNDLQQGLERLSAPPKYLYLLDFSPRNVKQDGTYHHLKVKVRGDNLKIQARPGYFATKPGKEKR